jgi:cytochrome c oxidase subunit 3
MSTVKVDSQGNKYAEHYKDFHHQDNTARHGVWLFLVTEVMTFSALFVAYAIFKNLYPEVFHEGHKFLDWRLGATNTLVLLTSSLTMVLAIYCVQTKKKNLALLNLAITWLSGLTFMVIKYFEYSHKIHEGLMTGRFFHYAEAQNQNLALYFGVYYTMTGLHGIHVLCGMGLIAWCFIRTKRGDFTPTSYTALEGVGLFWHLVDLIWIFLFPLLYLVT